MDVEDSYELELRRLLRAFASNMRRLRKRRPVSYSQEDLAEDARLHRTEISKLERAQRDPRLSTLLILADALEVGLDELAAGLTAPKQRRRSPLAKRGPQRAEPSEHVPSLGVARGSREEVLAEHR